MQRLGSTSMRPKGGWSSSGTQNMQASIGQYSMQAGEPAQPVQQSVVIARILGFFFRVALPSPSDIGKCFSRIEIIPCAPSHVSRVQLNFNTAVFSSQYLHGKKFLSS